MKFSFVAIISISLLLSCSKEPRDGLQGKWKWVITTGGIGGWTHTPESSGNTVTLEISDTHIDSYQNGDLLDSREYTLEQPSGEQMKLVYNTSYFRYCYFDEDSLSIWDPGADGFHEIYVRK